jgi:hypothetical protein
MSFLMALLQEALTAGFFALVCACSAYHDIALAAGFIMIIEAIFDTAF